ncbi:MAG: apolipoprotein N-acyltransferase [Bacteroidales bacterium]|nr:apolipoprotein N-acyltransferase [Bacteroidales bacterium]
MNLKNLLISAIAGATASMAWIPVLPAPLIFISFILWIHIYLTHSESREFHTSLFINISAGFLIYNIISLAWIGRVTVTGAVMVMIVNSFMAGMVFWTASLIHRRTSRLTGLISLGALWLTYEKFTMSVPFFTPWLNPGNVFGHSPRLVQWYEFTGAGGGSLWILAVAATAVVAIASYRNNKRVVSGYFITSAGLLVMPVIISLIIYYSYKENENDTAEIVIVQPSIDPYMEKFTGTPFYSQLRMMKEMAAGAATGRTDWIILPETAIDDPFYEAEASGNQYIELLSELFDSFPDASVMTGATTMVSFPEKSDGTHRSAGIKRDGDYWYEVYNSAVALHKDKNPGFYHKSKLIPGIEMSINWLPGRLERILPDLGGTGSGYGIQRERRVFTNPVTGTVIAPVICYESLFGEFVGRYVANGADIITIITNDGWWGNSQGYRQHLGFASLRAIETRRAVARAANTGISALINQRGDITVQTGWWERDTLRGSLSKGTSTTLYVIHGNYLYRLALIYTIIISILTFIASPIRKLRR